MKSEERHELATNELAQMIGDWISRVKRYISHILILIILIAVGVIVFQKYQKSSQDSTQEAMLSLMPAISAGVGRIPGLTLPEMLDRQIPALEKYIENYPDSPLLDLARLSLANRLYDRGIVARADEVEVTKADGYLERAGKAFDELKDAEGRVGELARFGADCVVKARGNAAEAIDRLTQLAQQKPDTLIADLANERIEIIRDAKPLELSHDEKVEEKESKDDGGEPETDQGDKTGPVEGEKGKQSATESSAPHTGRTAEPVEVKTPEAQNRSPEAEKKEQDSVKEK